MASVNSPIRKLLKPILFKILGKQGYFWFHFFGKLRDIKKRLVEEKEMELLHYFIKSGNETLDIGANYAYYTVRMAELVGESGKVYAFEPISFTCKIFNKLIAYFKLKNVVLFEKGVGDQNNKVAFNVPLQEFGAPSTGLSHLAQRNNELDEKEKFYQFNHHQTFLCDIVRIDDFLLKDLKNLTFIKMDIEGAEYFALKGMLKTLEQFKPVMIVEIQPFFLKGFGIQEQEILNLIQQIGYKMFLFNKQNHQLTAFLPPLTDSNYVLIPNVHLAQYSHLMTTSN